MDYWAWVFAPIVPPHGKYPGFIRLMMKIRPHSGEIQGPASNMSDGSSFKSPKSNISETVSNFVKEITISNYELLS